jgi:hypothetical protein
MYGLYHATATKLSIASCGLLTIVLNLTANTAKQRCFLMPRRLMVGRLFLEQAILVRIQARQP